MRNLIIILMLTLALMSGCASVEKSAKIVVKSAELAESATQLKKSYRNVRAAVLQTSEIYTFDELEALRSSNIIVEEFYHTYKRLGNSELGAETVLDVSMVLSQVESALTAISSMIDIIEPRAREFGEPAKTEFFTGLNSYAQLVDEYENFLKQGNREAAIKTGLKMIQGLKLFL